MIGDGGDALGSAPLSRKRKTGKRLIGVEDDTASDYNDHRMSYTLEGATMSEPLVIAHHLIWTAYGCWLPNDPRGSGSTTIRKDVLHELGELHYGRKKIQPAGCEVRRFYQQAPALLRHALLTFGEQERQEIGDVVARFREECKGVGAQSGYKCHHDVGERGDEGEAQYGLCPGCAGGRRRGMDMHSDSVTGAGYPVLTAVRKTD